MLYDMDFENPKDPQPMFFRAELKNGTLTTDRRIVEVRG
jgi:CRISPR-associated protein Cas5d